MKILSHASCLRNVTMALFSIASLAGCLSDEQEDPLGLNPEQPSTNSAPSITGAPPANIDVSETYSFTPNASDPDGDSLTFSVSNKPAWASFDSSNGRLSGAPTLGDVGTDSGIVISVSDGTDTSSLNAFSITVNMDQTNSAPTISGTPASSVNQGQGYSFTPVADDADGDTLTFSISGLPSWASFTAASGSLGGTPGAADVGVYTNIVISVSDGQVSTALPAFSISVNAISLGSVTLDWTAPTENEDGTPLTDLAGYKIYWGTSPGDYPNSATIDNPSVTTYVVENLAPGTYEFVATSVNSAGVESRYSGIATRTVP